jgi:hypothetical protein
MDLQNEDGGLSIPIPGILSPFFILSGPTVGEQRKGIWANWLTVRGARQSHRPSWQPGRRVERRGGLGEPVPHLTLSEDDAGREIGGGGPGGTRRRRNRPHPPLLADVSEYQMLLRRMSWRL